MCYRFFIRAIYFNPWSVVCIIISTNANSLSFSTIVNGGSYPCKRRDQRQTTRRSYITKAVSLIRVCWTLAQIIRSLVLGPLDYSTLLCFGHCERIQIHSWPRTEAPVCKIPFLFSFDGWPNIDKEFFNVLTLSPKIIHILTLF